MKKEKMNLVLSIIALVVSLAGLIFISMNALNMNYLFRDSESLGKEVSVLSEKIEEYRDKIEGIQAEAWAYWKVPQKLDTYSKLV